MQQIPMDNIPEYDRKAREVPQALDLLLSLHSLERKADNATDRWWVLDVHTGKRIRDRHGDVRLSFAKPLGVYIIYLRMSKSMRELDGGRDTFEDARDEYERQLKRRTHASNSSSRNG